MARFFSSQAMNDVDRVRDLAHQLWVAEGRRPVPRDQLIKRANAILGRGGRDSRRRDAERLDAGAALPAKVVTIRD